MAVGGPTKFTVNGVQTLNLTGSNAATTLSGFNVTAQYISLTTPGSFDDHGSTIAAQGTNFTFTNTSTATNVTVLPLAITAAGPIEISSSTLTSTDGLSVASTAGTVTIDTASSVTGQTSMTVSSAGDLTVQDGSTVAAGTGGTDSVTLASGGALTLTGSTANAGGGITLTAPGPISITTEQPPANPATGAFPPQEAMAITAGGAITITAGPGSNGNLIVTGATLTAGGSITATASGTGTLTGGSLSGATGVSITTSGSLTFTGGAAGSSVTVSATDPLSLTSTAGGVTVSGTTLVDKTGTITLRAQGGAMVLDGTAITGGTAVTASASDTLTDQGGTISSGSKTLTGTLTLTAATNLSVQSAMLNASGAATLTATSGSELLAGDTVGVGSVQATAGTTLVLSSTRLTSQGAATFTATGNGLTATDQSLQFSSSLINAATITAQAKAGMLTVSDSAGLISTTGDTTLTADTAGIGVFNASITATLGNVHMSANGGDLTLNRAIVSAGSIVNGTATTSVVTGFASQDVLISNSSVITATTAVTFTATGVVTIDHSSVTTTSQDVTLTANGGNITEANVTIQAARDVLGVATGDIAFTGNVVVTAVRNVELAAGGFISLDSKSTVNADNGNVLFDAGCTTAAIGCAPTLTVGYVSVTNGSAITAGQNVTFTAGGAITVSGSSPVTAQGGNLTFTALGGGITVGTTPAPDGSSLRAPSSSGVVSLTADAGNVTISDGLNVTAGLDVLVVASGNVTVSTSVPVTAGRNVGVTAGGSILVTQSSPVTAQVGSVSFVSGCATWASGCLAPTVAGGNITVSTSSSVTGHVDVTFAAGGAITVAGNTNVTAQTDSITFTADGGDITLEQIVAATAANNVTFTAVTGSILVGAPYTVVIPGVASSCTATACTPNPYETKNETTSLATVTATTGQVLWQASLNVTQSSLSTTTAGMSISIYGDFLNLDLGGSVITLAGTLTVTTPWSGGSAGLIQVFGNTHNDQFTFQQTQLNGRTRVYGSKQPTPASAIGQSTFAPEGDGNDTFTVNELQPMNGISSGDKLTLDGQSGANTYSIFTWGSQSQTFAGTGTVINVLDTGAPTTGSQTLNIYGNDNNMGDGINPTTGQPYNTNDIFLLRSVPSIDFEGGQPALYTGTSQQTAGDAFVALLHAPLATTQNVDANGNVLTSPTQNFPVERINYDSALSGGVHVFGVGGNDYFAVDDNAASTYLTGGPGDTTFQIGQIYGERRTSSGTDSGNLASENTFDVATIATTRGWVSRGTSAPLVAQAGCGFDTTTDTCRTGNDTFIVYSNQAPIHLEGDGGNNLFVVRGFALAQTDSSGNLILPAGCSAISTPNCLPLPITTNGFSTAAETDVRTGAGNNQVEYNMNAPVSVDGGLGFNKLVILGTEFADHIVVTDQGIFGAGMSVTYRNIQVIEIDALQGDDTIDVLSTAPGVAVRVVGGDGSNQINVAGDVNGNVYSQDINGTSSVVNHQLTSADLAYDNLVVSGVSVNVAQSTQGAVIVTQQSGGTVVSETSGAQGTLGTVTTYRVRLAQAPTGTVYVRISAEPDTLEQQSLGGDSILVAAGQTPSSFSRSIVLVFDASNWSTDQYVSVAAVNDAPVDSYPGTRVYEISTSVLSTDSFYENAQVGLVEVTKIDNSLPAIDVTALGNTNGPGIYADRHRQRYDNVHIDDRGVHAERCRPADRGARRQRADSGRHHDRRLDEHDERHAVEHGEVRYRDRVRAAGPERQHDGARGHADHVDRVLLRGLAEHPAERTGDRDDHAGRRPRLAVEPRRTVPHRHPGARGHGGRLPHHVRRHELQHPRGDRGHGGQRDGAVRPAQHQHRGIGGGRVGERVPGRHDPDARSTSSCSTTTPPASWSRRRLAA